jgi:curved DNA-binding protein CbpA
VKFVSQNYYEILDVDPAASHEDVKRAFRLVRASFEPDSMAIYSLYSPEETEAIGAKIDEAFRILTDRDRRRVYDKYLRSTRTLDPVPDDPDEFFDNVHDIHELSALEELVDGAMGEATVARADVSIEFDDEDFDEEDYDGGEFDDEIEVPVQLDPELPPMEIEDPSLEEFVDAPIDEQVLELPLGLGDPDLDERASVPAVESTVGFGHDSGDDEPSVSSARLRSWSREYAVERQNAASAFRLRPLDDRLLGEVRKERALTGSALQRLRRERGVDLDTIAERTKISKMYLRFIEGDVYDNLPAAIYLKGFVDQYATLLDLPNDLVDRYMEHYQRVCG